ncbi:MAG: hypothetical protein ACLVJN_04615 [Streptococcus parasanguinis]
MTTPAAGTVNRITQRLTIKMNDLRHGGNPTVSFDVIASYSTGGLPVTVQTNDPEAKVTRFSIAVANLRLTSAR